MSNWSRAFLLAIVVALAVAVFCATNGTGDVPTSASWAAGALAVLALLLVAWFVQSFALAELPSTGPKREEALTDIYAFAYVFTLLSLALLALPFGNLLNAQSFPETGPIRLLRGCVVSPAVPTTATPGETAARPAATAMATAPASPAGKPDTPKSATKSSPGAVAANAARPAVSATSAPLGTVSSKKPAVPNAAASEPERAKWPQGLPICGADPQDTHTVLVAIGGVIASSVPAHGASASVAGGPASIYQVSDGFVVSSMMVALAIVGAVVNLMRRIPEFQKRTHVDFAGTDKEPQLQPCEAREFVAFQVLQLIAAPFIAMVASYVIAPQSLTSAIALAFVSGLFSEGVLLRIRALVEGPDKTPTQATTKALGELEIAVTSGGNALPGAKVAVTLAASGKNFTEAVSDALGMVVLKSVPIGKLHISAVGPAPGLLKAVPKDIELAAGQRQRVDLAL